jgi:hypothetical protein
MEGLPLKRVHAYFLLAAALVAASFILILPALASPHSEPQPHYFALDNATVDNATQITVYLHAVNVNNSKSFNITTVYVDGASNVSLSPPFAIISNSIVQKFIITGNGVNWTDGNFHAIKFYSSDGNTDTFMISNK